MAVDKTNSEAKREELILAKRNQLLHGADEIRERLKGSKLSLTDREILARNLGAMYEASQTWADKSLLALLIHTFGEADGTAKNKKRKSIILLDGEEPPANYELRARAHDYITLAEALSAHPSIASDETRKLALARLVYGSSFDYQDSHSDRMDASTLVDVYKCLSQLSKRVQREVDMSWLRAWSTKHHFLTLGPTGAFQGIATERGLREETWVDYELHGPIANNVCPSVTIGWIQKTIPDVELLNLGTFDSDSPDDIASELRSRFNDHLNKAGLNSINDFDYIGDSETDPGDSLDQIFSKLREFTELNSLTINRKLDVELRFDSLLERWKTCLLIRPLNAEVGDYQDITLGLFAAKQSQFIRLGWEESDDNLGSLISLIAIKDISGQWKAFNINDDTTYHFLGECVGSDNDFSDFLTKDEITSDELAYFKKSVFGYEEGTGLFDKLLLATNYAKDFDYDWAETLQYVPAPAGSIASYILRSFCFAPEGQRLDELLVKDAKRKYQALYDYHKSRAQVYSDALNQRLSEST